MYLMEITIDELARRARMSSRNVRAHQTRGLLPKAALRGRTAYYDERHLDRLAAIQRLQAEGASLDDITQLVASMPDASEPELLALARAADGPIAREEPVVVDAATVLARWREQATPQLLARIEALGHVRALGDGRYEILSPRLYRAAAEATRVGVPLPAITTLSEEAWRACEPLADAFAALFAKYVSSAPPASIAEVAELRDRLRQVATDSVAAIFELALDRALER